jgi:hypothetical protein
VTLAVALAAAVYLQAAPPLPAPPAGTSDGTAPAVAALANPTPAGAPAAAPGIPAPPAPMPFPVAATPAYRPPQAAEDAATTLERARAAYEYGDIDTVVESARAVADGALRPTPAQRAQALRLLGIGLFVTGRPEGAETAFFDLLRLKPGLRLDPTHTRPDVVAFFENVRARHQDEIRRAHSAHPGKSFVLSLLPPAGQFQNGNRGRGYALGAIELLSLGTTVGTYVQLKSWVDEANQTFPGHTETARTLKVVNNAAVGVFAATVIVGIIDGIANFDHDSDTPSFAFLTPNGIGFRF